MEKVLIILGFVSSLISLYFNPINIGLVFLGLIFVLGMYSYHNERKLMGRIKDSVKTSLDIFYILMTGILILLSLISHQNIFLQISLLISLILMINICKDSSLREFPMNLLPNNE